MDFSYSVVADFAVIMIVAAITVYIFYKLKQPMIIGYLIAGVIVGPYTPPFSFISQPAVFSATADLGVIMLLFSIGLRFPLTRFKVVGKVSIGVAAIEIAVMLLISFGISRLLGWTLTDALFLGTALASSSTTIIAKVLSDMGKLHETPALIMLGVLVAEDLVVVGLLAVITSAFGSVSFEINGILWLALKIIAFLGLSLGLGIFLISRIINHIVKMGNNEVLLLILLGLLFGLSIIAHILGFSVAIGAFLMGVIVAGSRYAGHINNLIAPIKDMFAAVFFVSMGALINVTQFQDYIIPALIVTLKGTGENRQHFNIASL